MCLREHPWKKDPQPERELVETEKLIHLSSNDTISVKHPVSPSFLINVKCVCVGGGHQANPPRLE